MRTTTTSRRSAPWRLLAWLLGLWWPIAALSLAHAGTGLEGSVTVRLTGVSATGMLPEGQPVTLRLILTGPFLPSDHLIAVVEGGWVTRRLVSFVPEKASQARTASLTLDPFERPLKADPSQPARFDVSVARVHGMQLQPILTRAFYLTVSRPAPPALAQETPPLAPLETEDVMAAAPELPPGLQPADGVPLPDGEIGEEELATMPVTRQARPYWEELNQTIQRRWQARTIRPHDRPHERATVVSFLLLATGDAQLVQVERSSGSAAFDDEALRAVVAAHPFPPLPAAVTETPVTVHVVFRQGAERNVGMALLP